MPSDIPSILNVENLQESLKRFTSIDYAIFVSMLLICLLIGIYFGIEDHKKRKRRTQDSSAAQATEYLRGGGNMPVIPISLSLTASLVSGNMLLGEKISRKKTLSH